MRRTVVLATASLFLIGGCSPPASSPAAATPQSAEAVAADNVLSYAGAYRTSSGVTYVVNGHGHLLNLQDSSFRQLYTTASPSRLTIGRTFGIASPKEADVTFRMAGSHADQLTLTPVTGPRIVATRLAFKESEVSVPASGAVLAATETEPLTPGPHPGIVIVHGSGPGPRIDYGVWVGLYASLGLTVLTYDKRGNGASTGGYPGESASESNLDIYAADAATVLRFLASRPGIDPRRVGFHGGSQGGWVVPLAIQRYHAPAAFAIIASGPAVSVDQQDLWASFSAGSTSMPGFSEAEMLAQVRAVSPAAYDPAPVLAQLTLPMLWFNGAVDRQVPATITDEVLQRLHRPQWDLRVLPGVDHGLFENPSGLFPDEPKSVKLASSLYQMIAGWLSRAVGVAPPSGLG